MEKETYNIDDILSEVKKRKQEREESAPSFEIKTKNSELPAEKPNKDDKPEESKAVEAEEQKKFDNLYVRSENGITDSSIEEEEKKRKDDVVFTEEKPVEIKTETEPKADEEAGTVSAEQEQQDEETVSGSENGFVDLLSFADNNELDTEIQEKEKVKFFKTKKGKVIRNVIIVLLAVVLIAAACAGVYVYKALNAVSDDDNNASKTEQRYTAMDKLIENFPEVNETDADHLSSLQDMIKTWYYNGVPCSSSHVLNVLLVGEDTRGDEILEEDTRADAAIIVSINTDNKQITLTSILRDTYAYWENVPGDETTGEFGKINGAMAMGGISCYINCVEKMYKIDIDDYVIVNFDSFEGIVDELGGVDIEITSAEINEINNHQERYGYVTIEQAFEGNSGVMRLTGEQALAYCRIRKLDSDNMRADRQKICLTEIFNGVRDGSSVTLLKVVNKLLPYVKTGFSTNEIISISKYALSQGWLSYDINMTSVPNARINEKGAGGVYYGAWCWKADFPQDANYLQTLLYGRSSVVLAEKRVDILNCNLYGFYNESLVPCYAVIHNNSYGEATTYESTTEEDTQTTN